MVRLLPERRQHLRIVTLKNAAWLLGGLIVLFLAVSAWNELRPADASRERLYERGSGATTPATTTPAAPAAPDTIEERPIADHTYSVRGRESGLAAPPPSPPPAAAVAATERPSHVTFEEARQRGERIVITGGAEGMRVEARPASAIPTETAVPPDRF